MMMDGILAFISMIRLLALTTEIKKMDLALGALKIK
jgi:hypothetical protein